MTNVSMDHATAAEFSQMSSRRGDLHFINTLASFQPGVCADAPPTPGANSHRDDRQGR